MVENAASRARYQHRPLRDTDSIRVLHLPPGAFNDAINIELTEVSLSRPPSYEAISYVWGSPTPTDPISCHGEDILVTANCISAIRHLRHKKKRRTLWIDVICIDQSSMNERNHQVGLMGDIYSKAKRVVIWLGKGSEESDFSISFFKRYYRISKYLPLFQSFLLSTQWKKLQKVDSSLGKSDFESVFDSIRNRPWFSRKWTIQEYVLGHDAIFQCGHKYLQASQLFSANVAIARRRMSYITEPFLVYRDVFNKVKRAIEKKHSLNRFSLMQILDSGRGQVATEPKDAVFALYGLLQRINPEMIAPDYSTPVEQIYTNFTRMAIQFDKSLEILEATGEDSTMDNLPSWVPDFNTAPSHDLRWRLSLTAFHPSATGISTPAIFAFPNRNQHLTVRGRIVDGIQNTTEHVFILKDLEDQEEPSPQYTRSFINQIHNILSVQPFQRWIEMAENMPMTLDKISFRNYLFRTLNHRELLDQKADWETFETWLQCFSSPTTLQIKTLPQGTTSDLESNFNASVCNKASTQAKEETERERECNTIWERISGTRKVLNVHFDIYTQCRRTKLFVTSDGLLGKGLKNIQDGDSVALIAGVNTPMVLRKAGDLYRSMGPAYIDGMMRGEMWPKDEKDLIDIVLI